MILTKESVLALQVYASVGLVHISFYTLLVSRITENLRK